MVAEKLLHFLNRTLRKSVRCFVTTSPVGTATLTTPSPRGSSWSLVVEFSVILPPGGSLSRFIGIRGGLNSKAIVLEVISVRPPLAALDPPSGRVTLLWCGRPGCKRAGETPAPQSAVRQRISGEAASANTRLFIVLVLSRSATVLVIVIEQAEVPCHFCSCSIPLRIFSITSTSTSTSRTTARL